MPGGDPRVDWTMPYNDPTDGIVRWKLACPIRFGFLTAQYLRIGIVTRRQMNCEAMPTDARYHKGGGHGH